MPNVELVDELDRLEVARLSDVNARATGAQGAKADTAIQPAELSAAIATRATAAQGAKADSAIQQAALDAAVATRATTAQGAKADAALPAAEVGQSVASLVGGKVPAGQLPSLGTTDNVPEGVNNKYFSAALTRLVALGALTLTNAAIVVGDTYEAMFGKLQAQINALVAAVTANAKTCIPIACSDETTALTAGTGKVTFRMPFALTGVTVRASLTTPQTSGSLLTIDVKEGGASIFSTKPTFDNAEKSTTSALTPAVVSDASLAEDAEITIDISQIGDGTAKGLKVYILGNK